PVEVNIAYLYNEEGDIIGSVGINRDITERRKAEKEIREAKEYLENLFKTSSDAIMVTDPQGTITMVNDAMEKIVGYSKDELLKMQAVKLAPKGKEHERGKEFAIKLFEDGVITRSEHTWLRKDGSIVEIEINAALLKDSDGTTTGAVASVRDITERKRVEREIREARDFLENIFKTSADGIIITDPQGTITGVNNAVEKMLGYTQEELIGKHVAEFSSTTKQYREKGQTMIAQLMELLKWSVCGIERMGLWLISR
ncbi:MAG: PAS domain S-box protein, partial [Deltaproteobacteria bacterium]|nr:PAS domain S-box protein [Deltaproteobacteria bacterium]